MGNVSPIRAAVLGLFAFMGSILLVSLAVHAQPGPEVAPDSLNEAPVSGTEEAEPASEGESTDDVESDAEVNPWQDAEAVAEAPALPTFLDTTDRRIEDSRPRPTAAEILALQEMEQEVERFRDFGRSYRDSVIAVVKREFQRRQRGRSHYYARQIRQEDALQNEARDNAIRLFERFVSRYPNDPTFTPDAMFRLGELYFERSAIEFQDAFAEAQEAMARGEELPEGMGSTPIFSPTIELYRTLISRFPQYDRLDGVYYLIGYCLNEMNEREEAVIAWLSLVCSNHYSYDADEIARKREADALRPDPPPPAYPALTLDMGGADAAAPASNVDPYRVCVPVRPDAKFMSETWFRVGEYHFDDYGGDNAVELSISAYRRILQDRADKNFNLALYKVAWAYYRASRYPEAIRHFAQLVDWSDEERRRTGRAGSELRPEALQYVAIALAYDDWNENQVPDPYEEMPTGIQRLQDAELIAQDRDWTPEVYFQLGNVYFDENKLSDAIAVWQLALDRFPNHVRAPEITNMVARAYTRSQEMEQAIAYRARLGEYGEGSTWWNANVDHPAEQTAAEELAENALIGTAVFHHQQAQNLRRMCVEQRDLDLCLQARGQYQLAAKAYSGYLERYPNTPQAYELRYNVADALYWSEDFEAAAAQYSLVRDSNLDDSYLSESARRVVESLRRIQESAVERGDLVVREEPPAPSGEPLTVRPVPMPDLVQRLAQARELYLARVEATGDAEGVRDAYDYNNTLLLYFYGYWPQAEERFRRIFENHCAGEQANENGRFAWLSLRNMAVTLGDELKVEQLANELGERKCTFSTAPTENVSCDDPANADEPHCIRMGDLNALRYRRALRIYSKAEEASGEEQLRLYERAATVLVNAVNDNPDDPQAPIALEYAATALEKTSRFESAARLYQRITDEVGPRQAENAGEQQKLNAILANAYFRLAFNSNRFFNFERAVDNYRLLADSQRFRGSTDPNIVEKREGALINAAIILERLQQYKKAASYYREAAVLLREPGAQRDAYYRVAEMTYKQGNPITTIKEMNSFISRYEGDQAAGELVVLAYWRIAESRRKMLGPRPNPKRIRDYRKALEKVVSAFARSGQEPGSIGAEYAANAKFILVDDAIKGFESFSINPGRPKTLQDYVNSIKEQIDAGAASGQEIVAGYAPVMDYRRPTWTIAAFVRQGRVYEVLARAILNTPFTLPQDMQKQLRRLTPEQRDDIAFQVEGSVQQVLDEKVRPIECFAVARYALAARAARAGNLDDEYTQIAVDRLQAYGEERIAECIAEAQRADPSFVAYTPGEFKRAPRGRTLDIPQGVSPPSLEHVEGP